MYFRIQQNQGKGRIFETNDINHEKYIQWRQKGHGNKYMGCFFDEIWCRYCEMNKNGLDEIDKKTRKVMTI